VNGAEDLPDLNPCWYAAAMKHPRVALVRLPGAPAGIPALPADLMQPLVDESHVAYFQPTPPPFYFFHSSHLPAGTVSPPHRHPCLAFHGCLQGPVSLFIGKEEHVVDGGVFYLIAPGVVHSWTSRGPHTAAHISMLLDQRRPAGWGERAGVAEALAELSRRVRGAVRFRTADDAALKTVFWDLADLLMADRPQKPATTAGLLLTLLGRLAERVGPARPAPTDEQDTAEAIRRLLLGRLGDALSIDDVAREICLSPTQAKRVFRATYGCGIMAYFNQMKIWQAKRLLMATSMTVEQIGRKLGYSTPSYFSRAFQRAAGQSPKEFRDQVREG